MGTTELDQLLGMLPPKRSDASLPGYCGWLPKIPSHHLETKVET